MVGRVLSTAAVDLGASSCRVGIVDWDGGRLQLREAWRFQTPRRLDPETGYQCWDLELLEREVRGGLEAAARMAALLVW